MLFRSLVFFATLFNFANAFVVSGSGRSQAVSLNAGKETVESVRKKEFVSIMAEELGYTKTDAEAALNCAINIITNVSTGICGSIIYLCYIFVVY